MGCGQWRGWIAEEAGYEVVITADTRISIDRRKLALIVLARIGGPSSSQGRISALGWDQPGELGKSTSLG